MGGAVNRYVRDLVQRVSVATRAVYSLEWVASLPVRVYADPMAGPRHPTVDLVRLHGAATWADVATPVCPPRVAGAPRTAA